MPKQNSEVITPNGKGTAYSLNMLKLEVRVKMDDGAGGFIFKDYPADQLKFKKTCAPEKDKDEDEQDDADIL